MEFTQFTDPGLLSMYDAITKALIEDDDIPEGQPKEYGVREFSDWRVWGAALEKEIKRRGLSYTPIPWSER